MHRRQLLQQFLALGTTALLPGLLRAAGTTHDMGVMAPAAPAVPLLPVDALPAGQPLASLVKLANQSTQPGRFQATLTAAPTTLSLVPGHQTEFWAYNGSVPGPLIEVMEGDQIEITFQNKLSQPTTIHWHGMPIPPEQDGNPQDAVAPGTSRLYRFTLPKGSAGTYWYHPHPHGHTVEQVFRGLAGVLIVRAADDPLRHLPERLLVVSDLKLAADATIAPNDANDWMNGREGQFALVNGQCQPKLTFDTGGQERWRILNASSARYLRLTLADHPFTLVGTDGGLLASPQPGQTELLLTPAQRVEVVVTAQRAGRAVLTAQPHNRGKMGTVPPEKALPLLTVDFAGPATAAAPLPATLRPIPDLGPVIARKRVVFGEEMSMANGQHSMRFLLNGGQYDMNRVDLTSRVGEVEEWEVVNDADMDHPFHLHGTQFIVIERTRDGKTVAEPFPAWHDTVNLVAGERLKLRCVQHHPGLRMFHCHILEHEEQGMMGTLRVV